MKTTKTTVATVKVHDATVDFIVHKADNNTWKVPRIELTMHSNNGNTTMGLQLDRKDITKLIEALEKLQDNEFSW